MEEEAACASSGLQTTLCFVLAYLACFLTLNHHQCPKLQHIELSVVFWVVFFFFRVKLKWKNGAKKSCQSCNGSRLSFVTNFRNNLRTTGVPRGPESDSELRGGECFWKSAFQPCKIHTFVSFFLFGVCDIAGESRGPHRP